MDNNSNESLTEKSTSLINKIKEITTLQDTIINILNSTIDNKTESRLVLTEQFFFFVCVFHIALTSYIYLQNLMDELNKQVMNFLQLQRKSNMNVKQSRMMKKKSRAA